MGEVTVWLALQQCEDLEDGDSLRHMYHIVRGAIMLNDANLLDLLLSEENVMDVVSSVSPPYLPALQYQTTFLQSWVCVPQLSDMKRTGDARSRLPV